MPDSISNGLKRCKSECEDGWKGKRKPGEAGAACLGIIYLADGVGWGGGGGSHTTPNACPALPAHGGMQLTSPKGGLWESKVGFRLQFTFTGDQSNLRFFLDLDSQQDNILPLFSHRAYQLPQNGRNTAIHLGKWYSKSYCDFGSEIHLFLSSLLTYINKNTFDLE